MAFTLTIASGPDTGTAFPFETTSAKFGRTADNDVVVKDGSASRSHCRVYEEGGKYFIEDLKSANGTKVNGTLLTPAAPQEMFSGDTITIGDVSFTFSLPNNPDATMMQPASDAPPPDINATMIGGPPPDLMIPTSEGMQTGEQEAAPQPEGGATMLKSPEELEAIKAQWKEKNAGATGHAPAKRPPTRPPPAAAPQESDSGEQPSPEGGATMLKSPEELEAIKAQWKEKNLGPTGEAPAHKRPATRPPPAAETPSGEQEAPSPEGGATMLKSPEELEALRAQWKKDGIGADTGPISVPPGLDSGPQTNPDIKEPGDSTMPPKNRPKTGGALARKGDDTLEPNDTREIPPQGKRAPLARGKKDDDTEEPSGLTAAEKARQKRELGNSLQGRLQLFWNTQPRNKKIMMGAAGGVVGLGFLGLLVFALLPTPEKVARPLPPEPLEIAPNAATIEQSFGLGDDVDYARPDLKDFKFSTQSPTRVVVILHYQAKDISKDEIAVTLNGADVGTVAPDTLDVMNRELEVVFPTNVVKPREENSVVFDNVRNPPGKDPWRIWNLWLEVLPMPELSPEDTVTEARNAVDRAKKAYDLREVGPENLYKAWKQYRQAWLLLESMQDKPQELYGFVRQQLKMIAPEMDRRCANLLLEIKKEQESPNANYKRIRDMLEAITNYFPTREHRCYSISKALLGEMSQ